MLRLRFIASLLLLCPPLYAAESLYQRGTIVDITKDVHTRELYSIVNTPVTQDDPYFQVSIAVTNVVYVGEYTPRHAADNLPLGWELNAEVQARIEKGHMFVRVPQGRELQLAIVKHYQAEKHDPKSADTATIKPR